MDILLYCFPHPGQTGTINEEFTTFFSSEPDDVTTNFWSHCLQRADRPSNSSPRLEYLVPQDGQTA